MSVSWHLEDDRSFAVNLGDTGAAASSSVLSFPPFALRRRFGFILDASVEDSLNQSSVTNAMVYMTTGNVRAVISGGSRATVAADQTFVLDASGSYNEDFANDGLVYRWSCVKIAPSLSASCDGFDSVPKFSAQINLDASLMTIDSTYAFTVSVSDGVNGSTIYSLATIDVFVSNLITPDLVANIGGITVPVSSLYNVPVSFDGVVSSSEAFSVSWLIDEPVNGTVSSVSFPAGGIVSFPMELPYTTFIPGRKYSFRLSVVANDGCIGGCEAFLYDIPFSVNSAPRSGYLLGSPSAGSLLTDFSFSAVGWVDMDLPLYYTFFSFYPQSPDDKTLFSPRAERSWTVAHLMSGDPSDANMLSVHVIVSDVFGYETASTPLTVTVLHDDAALASLQNEIDSLLKADEYSSTFMVANSLRNEIDPSFSEARFDCSDPNNVVECTSLADSVALVTEALATSFELDDDSSAQVGVYFSAVAGFYVNDITFASLDELVTSEGIARLFRIVNAMNSVCTARLCTDATMEELAMTVDRLVGLFDAFPEFVPSRRRLLTEEEALAAAAEIIDGANQAIIGVADAILQNSVAMGNSLDLSLNNYELHIEKGWPLLLNPQVLQGTLLLDSTLFDGDAASFGFHTVNVRLEEVPAANCANAKLPCNVTSSSLFSTVYINTLATDKDEPTVYSQGFLLTHKRNPLSLITNHEAAIIETTCDANEVVSLRCSPEMTYGYAYTENVTCPDLIPANSNISLRCPVYDVVALCAVDGAQNSDCIASQVTETSSLCLCPLNLQPTTSESIPSISVSGYETFSSSSRVNSIFGTSVTVPPLSIAPLGTEGGGSQSVSLNNILSAEMMLILIPLQILCCCCIILCCIFFALRRKKDEKSETDDETFDEAELFDDEDSIFDDISDDELFDDDGFEDDEDDDIFMDGIDEIDEDDDEVVTAAPSVASGPPEKVERGSILGLGDSDESVGTPQEAGERERKLDRWFDIVFEDGSNDYDNDGTANGSTLTPNDSFEAGSFSSDTGDGDEDDGSAEYSY